MDFRIRRVETDDYTQVHQIFQQPRVVAGTLQVPFPSLEMWRQRLSEDSPGRYSLVICVEEDVIGYLGLMMQTISPRRRHVGSIGMAIADDWQGKGAGSALLGAAIDLADNWLNLLRIELTVYADNAPAIALYKKFGFESEGVRRADAYQNGRFVDCIAMARVRLDRLP